MKYPDIQIEISISNRNVDLIAEGFDLAIRQGQLPNSTLIARPLEQAPLKLVASPAYLKRMGIPKFGRIKNIINVLPLNCPVAAK